MAMASSGPLATSGGHLDMAEIFHLLESSDLSVLDETVTLVRDNLGSLTEPWFLNGLVDYYINSGNILARNLLCVVRPQQHKVLMNKIDDYLQKVSTRLKSLNLLGHIVRNEPIWMHHIIATKTFQNVVKCLQVDNDLPTITSALYVTVTLLPKVACQVSHYISAFCGIYVRLVSWHTIKPAGALEANLVHLHTAVYALFLCLYGMYPCYFTRYLQHYFQVGSTAVKVSHVSEKEKAVIFENSVKPMLDQVRLHPRLITDSSDIELSNERWRKLESQDIIADISKVTLDVTENSASLQCTSVIHDEKVEGHTTNTCTKNVKNLKIKTRRADSDNEYVWSPSIAIGLSTPPSSRGISPTPLSTHFDSSQLSAKFQSLQAGDQSSNQEENEASNRPSSLSMNASDAFIPNRPHQTSSATSTPLKHIVPSLLFSSNPSPSFQSSSPQKDSEKKKNKHKSGEKRSTSPSTDTSDNQPAISERIRDEASQSTEISCNKAERVLAARSSENDGKMPLSITSQLLLASGQSIEDAFVHISCSDHGVAQDQITEFTPGLQPSEDFQVTAGKAPDKEGNKSEHEGASSAQQLLNLVSSDQYIEKSPNELLNMHVQLKVEAYTRCRDKFAISGKDPEWQLQGDSSGSHAHTAAEVLHLRSEVLQMHCAMLYERHRREQHALRARKVMRKVYNTTTLEEKNKTLTFQLQEKLKEIEERRNTERQYREKVNSRLEESKAEIEKLRSQLKEQIEKNKDLEMEKSDLIAENNEFREECETLKSVTGNLNSKLFTFEQQLKKESLGKDQVRNLEYRTDELQTELFESRVRNGILEDQLKEVKGNSSACSEQAKLLSEATNRELETLRKVLQNEETQLEVVTAKAEQFESQLQKKDLIIAEQKKYLENVKSLARGQIQAMEAKYSSQKNISQTLEIQVFDLFGKLAAIEGEAALLDRTRVSSGPRTIQPVSPLQSHHQHILSSSPQLSPPIRGGPLADNLWSQRK